jgi:hypothetical protein
MFEIKYIYYWSVVFSFCMGWMVWGSNPIEVKTFHTHPVQPRGSSSLLYNGYQVSYLGVKQPVCGINHPPPSSIKVKDRVELYLFSLPGFHGTFYSKLYLLVISFLDNNLFPSDIIMNSAAP